LTPRSTGSLCGRRPSLPKLPVVNGREAIRALERAGFAIDRIASTHHIMYHPERDLSVSVPVHGGKGLRPGTLRGIITDAGLSVEEFRKLLK
jgi:predicted RNA binding protein YcfA (HicA-like mRNA interferase family)